MEYVNPIKKIEKIQAMKKVLRQSSLRDLLLFVIGINTGIKVHDLLYLTVKDVWDGSQTREFLYLKDEKNGEVKAFYLNSKVREVLRDYLASNQLQPDDFLFKSKKNNQPITRQQAYRIINLAAKEVGIQEKIGTHTLRKTFGYHAYRKGVAISILKNIFNQHSTAETLKYIGIDKNEQKLIKVDVNL
ncbi:tyrosine-type recombinase/integrase [Caldifermentibacillus hisashii]|uniref:tyrosine-type recombinase/integrase n=1 Tax=Caldifermentibacillus hisashii TaxID=996558 RepID=UPI000BA4103B|nr:tyrosine-type recombinase/integrase [Caldifermentibacillus hisashii]PAC36443.1 site-specific integrase [Caldifermentibacillus hisashii]